MLLVGRGRELDGLDARWRRTTLSGEGTVVLVEGPAGIGKTALVQQWLHQFPAGTFTVETRADDFSRGVLDPIRWAVENATVPPEARRAGEVRRLILDLLRSPGSSPPHGIADLLVEFFDAASDGQPAVFLVEDLHAADDDTVQLCSRLARSTQTPLLLLVTTRPYRSSTALDFKGLVSSLADSDLGHIIELSPLGAHEVSQILHAEFGRSPTASEIRTATAHSRGNPLLVHLWLMGRDSPELPSIAARSEPSSTLQVVHDEVLRRHVAPNSSSWLVGSRLALLGRASWADADLLGEVLDISTETVRGTVEELISHGVLEEQHGTIDFTHPLIREAFASLVSAEEQGRFHLQVADRLCAHGTPTDLDALFEVAAHLMAAPNLPTSAHAETMFAAASAAMRISPAPSAQWFQRVRTSAVTPEHLRGPALAGEIGARNLGGATAAARSLVQQTLRMLDRELHTPELIEAAASTSFSTATLRELIEQAEQAAPNKRTPGTRSLLATAYAMIGRSADALRHYEPVVAEILAADDTADYQTALVMLLGDAVMLGRSEDLVALRSKAMEAADHADPVLREMLHAAIDMQAAYYPAGVHPEMVDSGPRTNVVSMGGAREVNQSFQHYLAGRWDTLLASAPPLIELLRGSGNLVAISMPAACAAMVLAERERWDDAEDALQQATWPWETYHGPLLAVASAKIHLGRGQTAAALQRLEQAYDWARMQGQTTLHTMVADQLCLVLESVGRIEEARRLAAEALARVEQMNVPLLNAFGRLAVARTTGSAAVAEQALQEAEKIDSPLLRIRCETLLAELGSDPADRLNRAHQQAKEIGAVSERGRVEQAMRRQGVPTPRGRGTAVALTNVESAVVRALIDGQTNRQIATTLHCSPKTIEMHLSRIYARTGRAGRVALVRSVTRGEVALADEW